MHIHEYAIIRQVGYGCITRVYEAVDPQTGRVVALKVLREDSVVEDARRLFAREVALLRRFDHARIPAFYAAVDSEPPAMAHQLIPGADLQALLSAQPDVFAESDVIAWALHVCDAFTYLHTHPQTPVVFRDLKPAHIMIDGSGAAYLVDFNLAVDLPPGASSVAADKAGTEGFAAPEQYEGRAGVTSDVYTLGATLHYLLTRRDPRQHPPFTFGPPRELDPALSEGVAAVITRALAHDPADRYQSAAALRAALVACG